MEGAEAASERPAATRRPRVRPGRVSDAKAQDLEEPATPLRCLCTPWALPWAEPSTWPCKWRPTTKGLLEMDVRTSTVGVVDDLEPLADDLEPTTQTRQTSAVHIRLFMPNVQKQE
ncbi:hypothetical protein MRX96_052320 [Rhipicephalus microplus]